jgi:hypothetical protein
MRQKSERPRGSGRGSRAARSVVLGRERNFGGFSAWRLLRAALAMVVFAASIASAGYLLVDKEGNQTLVSKGRVKGLSEDGDGPQSVFDLGRARAWMSNPERNVYWEGTIDELCTSFRETVAAMSKSAHQAMEEQIAKLPPEQRAKVEALRKTMAEKQAAAEREERSKPGVIKIERTAETAIVAGQPTRKYRVLVDGDLYREDWLSTDPSLAKEFALDRASELMSRVSACVDPGGAASAHGKGVDEGEIYRELYPHGWPLKEVSYRSGAATPKSEMGKIEKRDVPDGEFKPPPGYRKTTLREVMFAGMGSGPSTH